MLVKLTFYSLLVYIFSLGFMQPFVYLFDQKIQISDVIFIPLFVLFLMNIFLGNLKIQKHFFYYPAFFFLAAMLFSVFFSDNQSLGLIKLAGKIYLVLLPLLVFNLIEDESQLKKIFLVWICVSVICSSVGVLSIFLFYFDRDNPLLNFTLFHYGTLPHGNYPRLSATFLNANMLCNYLSVGVSMLLIARHQKWLVGKLFWPFLALFLICSLFTFSPGLGGIILIFALWIWICRPQISTLPAKIVLSGGLLAALFFLIATAISPHPQETALFRLNLPIIEKSLEPSARALTWSGSFQTFIEAPFFGKGVGQNVCQVIYSDAAGSPQLLTDAHNVFLNVAAESGIFGLSALMIIVVYFACFRGFSKKPVENQEFIEIGLKIAFFSAFVYQGLAGSFEDSRHLWVLMGLIMVCEKFELKKPAQSN